MMLPYTFLPTMPARKLRDAANEVQFHNIDFLHISNAYETDFSNLKRTSLLSQTLTNCLVRINLVLDFN